MPTGAEVVTCRVLEGKEAERCGLQRDTFRADKLAAGSRGEVQAGALAGTIAGVAARRVAAAVAAHSLLPR